MALYSVANRTTSGTTATAAEEVIAGSTVEHKIFELGLSLVAATASTYGFGRPGATGVTPTSPINLLAEDGGNTSGSTAGTSQAETAIAWGTGPTVPANFARRASLPATVGAGLIWTFPRGFITLKTLSTVLWNLATNSVADCWVVVDE